MALTEGVAATLAYKFYAAGTMSENSEADTTTDPGASGGQYLRRVSSSIRLRKTATVSQEILPSRQKRVLRHSGRRVEGAINGELSPGTYFPLLEAVHRDTALAVTAKSEADYTSITASASGKTLTLAGGNPQTDLIKIGHMFDLSGASVAANNRRFLIMGMSGTNGRILAVHPAPTDMTADSVFAMTFPGKRSIIPVLPADFVRRKLAIEAYRSDVDKSRLFTECRMTGYRVTAPAEGIVGIQLDVMGRNQTRLSAGTAPYFSGPTAISSTDGLDSINGVIMVAGSIIGIVTSLNFGVSLNADAPRVMQTYAPDILLGTADVTGELGLLVNDGSTEDLFDSETEFAVLAWQTASTGTAAPSNVWYMPRCKATDLNETMQGEGSQAMTLPFQALEYTGSAVGVPNTTIQLTDTNAA